MKAYSSFPLSRVFRVSLDDLFPAFVLGLIAVFFFIDPHHAMAQDDSGASFSTSTTVNSLGQLLCNIKQHGMGPLPDLFSAIAYIVGGFMIGNGLYEIVRHHDNPRERPIHHPLLRISVGGALMAAPYFTATLINTFFTTPATGGILQCTPGTVNSTSNANGVGLDVLITNLVGNISNPMTTALSALAVVMGLFMILRGLMKASKYNSDPRSHSMVHILSNLSIGALLVVVGQSLDMVMQTIFGYTQADMTGSSAVNGWQFVTQLGLQNSQFTTAIGAALNFFQLIGLIAFIRGWLILKNASEGSGQATMAQGITHIIGGTLALNIFAFLAIMDRTFGTGFL